MSTPSHPRPGVVVVGASWWSDRPGPGVLVVVVVGATGGAAWKMLVMRSAQSRRTLRQRGCQHQQGGDEDRAYAPPLPVSLPVRRSLPMP